MRDALCGALLLRSIRMRERAYNFNAHFTPEINNLSQTFD
jgi:hypothetical protein